VARVGLLHSIVPRFPERKTEHSVSKRISVLLLAVSLWAQTGDRAEIFGFVRNERLHWRHSVKQSTVPEAEAGMRLQISNLTDYPSSWPTTEHSISR
jgi:hypothetical protein